MRLPTREELLAADLPHEVRAWSIAPDGTRAPMTWRLATAEHAAHVRATSTCPRGDA